MFGVHCIDEFPSSKGTVIQICFHFTMSFLFCFSPGYGASARFVINSEVGCDIMHCNDGGWMQIIDIHASYRACSEPHPQTTGPLLRYSTQEKEVLFTSNNGREKNESLQWSHTSVHTHILEVVPRQVSNISRTLVGNKFVDHSDVVGTSPVGAAPTTSSFAT